MAKEINRAKKCYAAVKSFFAFVVRCNCEKSKCSQMCSYRGNNVVCTELCKCGGEGDKCTNIPQPMIGEDLDD